MIYSPLTNLNLDLRTLLSRWCTPVLLTLSCCTLVAHHVGLSGLAHRLDEQSASTDLRHLMDRLSGLEQSILQTVQLPAGVSYADLNVLNDNLNERITEIATAMSGVASQTELAALQQRIARFESTPTQPPVTVTSAKPKRVPLKQKQILAPAIEILGQELRAGQHFLSVGPLDAHALDQCQLIRVGDTYAGWKLEEIDAQTAVFSASGVTHRLNMR